ncbi:succinate dehydrogenase, hydrophobic membrane anchor protein [Paraurantiacibacter namhicola]|uniref:Succinate dehydrogenase hydrophobic membrane anchor subunit n=1 Tax=Paraurantiacibacter namhicola TaxID=645517 RepID=A0A1C7D8X7_9SPHN|nr:succinate dehydrogenase, hydrophobic membrane anchor protein [Paraurantiacibacter namhicola]ANU07812.1 succinate dehydrogenase cytochrome b556 small membrane subunit [Paraurantiacibacter namhicola]
MGNGTSIGKVRGLGAAGEGTHHWLLQRFTAIGNLLLVGFMVISFALLPDLSYDTVTGWMGSPIVALAMALMIISVFWHARLGMQVLVEDYVHNAANKFAAIVLLNLFAFGGAAAGLFFVLTIVMKALGGEIADTAMGNAMQGMGGGFQ